MPQTRFACGMLILHNCPFSTQIESRHQAMSLLLFDFYLRLIPQDSEALHL